MSKTPIFDFLNKYASLDTARFHMPGHKGVETLGVERYDITEIDGADSLYEADGIIAESEKNLSDIFGTRASFYSTEGSSLCIRAMVYLAQFYRKSDKQKILAARNVHKSFVSALALCGVEADFLSSSDLYSCKVDKDELENMLKADNYFAFYVTSPDYLGCMQNIPEISEVCHKYNVPLIVDNAHGAYLKFVGLHPVDLGADMCCDSAHKTLFCLTGSAYLHISKNALFDYQKYAKTALSLFASTSPSYLLMASMDLANRRMMSEGFCNMLKKTAQRVQEIKNLATQKSIECFGQEPIKLTLKPKSYGYYANEISRMMIQHNIYPEFCDKDNLVLMFSVNNTQEDFDKIISFIKELPQKEKINDTPPEIPSRLTRKMSVRQALFSLSEIVDVELCKNRILADASVSCPPAIPIAISGEVLDENAIKCFEYYGIEKIKVLKQ